MMMMSAPIFGRNIIWIVLVCSLLNTCNCENVKNSVEDNRDDNGDTNDESKDESLDIPAENEPNNITCTRRQNSMVHEIRTAKVKQFPFMAAVMSLQNDYLCSGVVVSNGLILTTADCTQQPISYVLLNTTKDKKDDTTAALHIIKTEKFPTYRDSIKKVGLIYTEKHNNTIATKIKINNDTNARNIIDFEAIGFGLNAEVGQTKELQYVGLENRTPYGADTLTGYIDCIDTKVMTCFKDTGGPIVSNNELLGIVTKGQDECIKEMTSVYAVNKYMTTILPTYTFKAWLDEKIKKHEALQLVALTTYPQNPRRSNANHQLYQTMSAVKSAGNELIITFYVFLTFECLNLLFF